MWAYARDLMRWRGVAATVDFDAIRKECQLNDGNNKPHGVNCTLPDAGRGAPHGRSRPGPATMTQKDGRAIHVNLATLEPQETLA